MPKRVFICAILLFIAGLLQVSHLNAGSDENQDTVRQILRNAYNDVKKNYYDPKYHGVDLDARYHDYDGRTKNITTLAQGFTIIEAFLEGLHDSHTFFIPPGRASHIDYGYRMQAFGDHVYVSRVRPGTDAEKKVHVGDEVLSFNRFPPHRTDLETMWSYFNNIAPLPTSVLTLRSPTGEQREVTVDARIQQKKKLLDLSGANGDTDFWQLIREEENEDHLERHRYIEMGDVMIWQMPGFDLSDEEVDHLFGIAKKRKVLILDLRGNGGGSVLTLERMVGNAIDHDVKIGDRIGRKDNMKPLLAKTRGDRGFPGKLVVLIDTGSFSASEVFAREIQLEKRGTILGDASLGKVMEAQGLPETLGADTKVQYYFSITRADLIMKDGKSLENNGVTPDEVVLPTAKDLAEGRDPVLARAAELAGVKVDPAAAGKLFPYEWLPFTK